MLTFLIKAGKSDGEVFRILWSINSLDEDSRLFGRE